MTIKNLTHQRFGRLEAICSTSKRAGDRSIIWLCRCDCGNLVEVSGNDLASRNTKSCGCLRREGNHFKHGDTSRKEKRPRFYTIWTSMNQRCFDRKSPNYKYYGGRGISICEEWLNYQDFKNWALANGCADNLTIDRINNDGDYKPNNCQWLTRSENTKKSHVEREL